MKKNVKSTAALKTAARNEVKVINNNPTYIMRTLNKLAKGSDKEAKAVEGYSIKAVKELYNRVNEAFGEGFWWNSVRNARYCGSRHPGNPSAAVSFWNRPGGQTRRSL